MRPGEDAFDLPAYAQRWGTWLVEQHVPQHPDLDVLNPYTLNTFRVITLLREGTAEVLYVMLKLGGVEGPRAARTTRPPATPTPTSTWPSSSTSPLKEDDWRSRPADTYALVRDRLPAWIPEFSFHLPVP